MRFVDLGYQIFFLPILGLGYVDTCYPSENGSSAGFPDPKLTPSQPLLWKWHFLPDLGANLENLGSRLRLVTFMAWSCASTWKICLEVSNPYSQPLVLGNVQKTAPKPPFRNRAAQPTRTTNVQFFFCPAGPDYPGRRIETIFGPSFCTKNRDKLR